MSKVNYYVGDILPEKDTIFVFGSNPEGLHGGGSARVAYDYFGAEWGNGVGMQGNSYALPTKDLRITKNYGYRSISPEKITKSIKQLYVVARSLPERKFKIAYRNTDKKTLNGYTGFEMMKMFRDAGDIPQNIYFSEEWVKTGFFN